jgi:hypothetical protein
MTAALPGSSVTEGAGSLEVRWISPGQLDAAVARWFGRFPAGVDSCEDSYLLDPDLRDSGSESILASSNPGGLASRMGATLGS